MTRRSENPTQPRRKNPPRGQNTARSVDPPRRPASKFWLESDCPADIDGAVDPPQFYARGLEEKNATRVSYGYPPWPPRPPLQDTTAPSAQPLVPPPTYAQVVAGATPLDPRLFASPAGPSPPGAAPPIPLPMSSVPARVSLTAPPVVGPPVAPSPTTGASLATPTIPMALPAVDDVEASVMVYLKRNLPPQPSKNGKPTSAKAAPTQSRMVSVNLYGPSSMSRTTFIKTCLEAHHIAAEYVVGELSGPDFKFWYTGSIGGQAGAPTVSSDDEFLNMISVIRRKPKAAVGISFDLDAMEGFRTRKRAILPEDEADHQHGPIKAPKLDDFDDSSRMKGHFTIKLQEKWKCNAHRGEHGEPGSCYVDAVGNHFGLNNNHFRTWSNSLAAGKAMLDTPPDGMVFGGSRDGLTAIVKPRGRSGNSSSRARASVPPDGNTNEMMNVAMLALLSKVTDSMVTPAPSHPLLSTYAPALPSHHPLPSSLSSSPTPVASSSSSSLVPSMPTFAVDVTSDLHACLVDLLPVDFLAVEEVFVLNELTPDLIASVDDTLLCSLTGAPLGRVMKLKAHCQAWSVMV